MKEKTIGNCCTVGVKPTPEQEIKYLKRDLGEAHADLSAAHEEKQRKEIQVQSLVDILCDLRRYSKELESNGKFDSRRMQEYRETLDCVQRECREVIYSYENDDPYEKRPNKAVYEFAKKIDDIVWRF